MNANLENMTDEQNFIMKRKENHIVEEKSWGSLTWFASEKIGNSNNATLGYCIIKAGYSNDKHLHTVLATKVYFPMGDGPNDRGLSRKHIMEQAHASLKRLDVDYVDILYCHRYDTETPVEETLRARRSLFEPSGLWSRAVGSRSTVRT